MSDIQFRSWQDRVLPSVERVRDGVWSIPLPLPAGSGMRHVNCYVFVGAGPLSVVDPGWAHDEGWEALRVGLALVGADLLDVEAVLVTHVHPDHYGLAPRLRAHSGATVRLHDSDAAVARRQPDGATLAGRAAAFLTWCGAPTAELSALPADLAHGGRLTEDELPDAGLSPHEPLPAGDTLLQPVWTPGHTPGHTCLYDEGNRLLLTGDHILPKVSPHVGAYHSDPASPLGDYLASLASLRSLDVAEVLPAHEYRFADLDGRIDQLVTHHAERGAEVVRILERVGRATTWSIAESLRWSRGWEQMPLLTRRSANAETLAHLRELERQDAVAATDSDVPEWYAVSGSASW